MSGYIGNRVARILSSSAVCLLAACDGGSHAVAPPVPGLATKLVLVSGGGQTAPVGDTLPARVVLQARDSAGTPVPGVLLIVVRDDHSQIAIFPDSIRTDSAGLVRLNFRLDTVPGAHTYEGWTWRGPVPPEISKAAFTETTRVGAPASISFAYQLNQSPRSYGGAAVPPPTFTVRDRYGNPVPNTAVSFRVDPGGSVIAGSPTTDSLGRVTPQRWTLGSTAGSYSLIASTGSVSATAVATAATGAPASLLILYGDKQQVGAGMVVPSPISIRVVDAAGLPVSGVPVVWSDASGVQCATITRGDGTSLLDPALDPPCRWRVGSRIGDQTITATAGNASATLTATVLERPAGLDVLSAPPSNAVYPMGASAQPDVVVQLKLPNGSPAAGYLLDLTATPQSFFGGVTPHSIVTDARGMATIQWPLPREPMLDSLVLSVHAYPDIRQTLVVGVSGPATFISIGAGDAHTCGGTRVSYGSATPPVLCWGRNTDGQLGDGTTTGRLVPTAAAVSFSGYTYHTSAGRASACVDFIGFYPTYTNALYPYALFCWGAIGQPGDASSAPKNFGAGLDRPSVGASHSCTMHGEVPQDPRFFQNPSPRVVYCWGDNRFGQLGDGTNTSRSTPGVINVSVIGTAIDIVGSGDGFSCAITADSDAYCWGLNTAGQLGDGTTIDRSSPVAVSGGMRFLSSTIAVGAGHACALVSDGSAYCWGRNDFGQLGDGTTVSRSTPVTVSGGIHFTSLAAGGQHTCGVTSAGAAYCWGANVYGQLGSGAVFPSSATPVKVAGSNVFASISAGGGHTCALTTTSVAYCWGLNADGQLGDGTRVNRSVPTPVSDFQPAAQSAVSRIR
jgi:hypothetical protein